MLSRPRFHRALAAFGLLIAAVLPCSAVAADIGVMPVAVKLGNGTDRSAVTVVNQGAEAVIMQVEAIAWRRVGQADVDAPTNDLIVNPPVITVQPGQSQLVRVGLRKQAERQAEGTYRIVLREVPPLPKGGPLRMSGQVTVLMALRVPVYVAPSQVTRQSRWEAAVDASGQITASVRNEGNVHVKVGRLQVHSADDTTEQASQSVAAVVFPGEEQQFKLRLPKAVDRPLTLTVATDEGAEQVPVVLARR